ncbi:hypothetical protein LTR37_006601 [Vermiconidia calcicola]|uniref:Uncharacterized protein n=1 Tax=Vermiconidia calcicola TaxID=1690605 RepID=A0ACC3NGW1_9PEZI|nr:hypothetical protein LTR37_006601 [Vermiconidia calcicola]
MAETVIDLTIEPMDYLSTLPTELQHNIIGCLFASHEPDKPFEPKKPQPRYHSLDALAATCRTLRGEVMGWALRFLVQHSDITRYQPRKTAKIQAKRDFLCGRDGLLKWAEKHCVFCGTKSSRSAIMMNGLHCCKECDRKEWPDKITKTDAKRDFGLNEHHLLPHQHHSGAAAKLLAKHPGGLPKLRYGTYTATGVQATMFLRHEVEALAKVAHGDLKAYLEKRQGDQDRRKQKTKETKAVNAMGLSQPTPRNPDPDGYAAHLKRIAKKASPTVSAPTYIPYIGVNDRFDNSTLHNSENEEMEQLMKDIALKIEHGELEPLPPYAHPGSIATQKDATTYTTGITPNDGGFGPMSASWFEGHDATLTPSCGLEGLFR